MNCEKCLPLVEQYFDHELDDQAADLVAEHMAACSSCASAYQKLQREQDFYRAYECDVEVTPAFWANVSARVAQENAAPSARPLLRLREWFVDTFGAFGNPRFSASFTAAIVLVAIAITVGVMRYIHSSGNVSGDLTASQNSGAGPTSPSPDLSQVLEPANSNAGSSESNRLSGAGGQLPARVALPNSGEEKRKAVVATSGGNVKPIYHPKPKTSRHESTPDELVQEAEQKYLAAIAMLSRDVKQRRSQLDAETLARFEQTLAAVDRTIAGTRRAVREHPGDPVAVQYMLTAYAKKVEVLREIASY